MGDRCTGDCCRAFWLPHKPEILRGWLKPRSAAVDDKNDADNRWIAAMVVPLDPQPTESPNGMPVSLENGAYYTCVNLLPNGDCGVYEARPYLCRDYPYGQRCEYASCTWSAVKANLPAPLSVFTPDFTALVKNI